MTDRPILFSTPMVKALLKGEKTQTRRLAKRQDIFLRSGRPFVPTGLHTELPFSRPGWDVGDRLWVRETWARYPIELNPQPEDIWFRADGLSPPSDSTLHKWRPGIHMPRWASRLTLTVTHVRVQRLQDISEEDAQAEGIERRLNDTYHGFYRDYGKTEQCYGNGVTFARDSFRTLWTSINGKRPGASWDDNPWTVALTFTVAKRNIDAPEAEAAA